MSILKTNTIKDLGGNTLLSSDGAGTLTLPSDLKATPAFHVSLSSDQSVANTTATKIQFDNEFLDTDNCWDSTTNYRFQPTVEGRYMIGGLLRFQSSASASQLFFDVRKNGSAYVQSYYTNSYYNGHPINVIVYLNGSTDYVEFFAHHNFGVNTNIPSTSANTYGFGYRLIGA